MKRIFFIILCLVGGWMSLHAQAKYRVYSYEGKVQYKQSGKNSSLQAVKVDLMLEAMDTICVAKDSKIRIIDTQRNKIYTIEEKSNLFLVKLNTNDFKGTIRIIEKQNGQGEACLMNNDSVRIFNPNTALKTTYLMSILFAIGNLSAERDETELPLLFDAPTSSFTDTKENEFFGVISGLKKQVIIVTKSFLRDGSNGEAILDHSRIEDIEGRVFRIEKKRPFDDDDY